MGKKRIETVAVSFMTATDSHPKKKNISVLQGCDDMSGGKGYLFQDVSEQRSCLVGRKELRILQDVTTKRRVTETH